MGKFIVRFTIVFVAIYMILSAVLAQTYGIDIFRYSYMLLFELCVVIYTFSEGKYHCKFIKWTMLGVFIADSLSHLDYYLDLFSVFQYNCLLGGIIILGIAISFCSALNHFRKVRKLKRQLNENRQGHSGQD